MNQDRSAPPSVIGSKKTELTVLNMLSLPLPARKESVLGWLQEGQYCHGTADVAANVVVSFFLKRRGNFIGRIQSKTSVRELTKLVGFDRESGMFVVKFVMALIIL